MVTGFEEITKELTIDEFKIVDIVVRVWNDKPYAQFDSKGRIINQKESLVKMNKMIMGLNVMFLEKNLKTVKGKPLKVNGPRMRKVIHHIRANGLVLGLVADSRGYYKTKDHDVLDRFAKSCRERSNSFLEIERAIRNQKFKL